MHGFRVLLLLFALLGVSFAQSSSFTNRTHIPSGDALPNACRAGDFFAVGTNAVHPGLYTCIVDNVWKFLPGVPVGSEFPLGCFSGTAFIRTDQKGPNFYVCDIATNHWMPPSDTAAYVLPIVGTIVSSVTINGGPPLVGNVNINAASAPTPGIVISDGTNLTAAVDGTDYLSPTTGVTSVNGQRGAVTVNAGGSVPAAGVLKSDGTALQTAVAGTDYLNPATGVTSVNGSHGAVTTLQAPAAGIVKSNGTTLSVATPGTDYLTSLTGVTTVNGFTGAVTVPSVPSAGIVKSNGTTFSAATAGTDYLTPLTGVTTVNGSHGAVTTLQAPGVGMVKSNGTILSVATAGTDYLTPSTGVTTVNGSSGAVTVPTVPAAGIVKSNGTTFSAATAGTDYLTPSTGVTTVNGSSGAVTVPSVPTAGIVKSNGTAFLAATPGTDYLTSTTGVTSVNGQTGAVTTAGRSINTVSFSATPAFNLALGDPTITLTGTVTSSTVSNVVAGQTTTVRICQDSTGGRSFTWPTAFHGVMTISTAAGTANANTCSVQTFESFDGTNLYATSIGIVNQ
jgi:limonene-1,2-epoxide hydrolase